MSRTQEPLVAVFKGGLRAKAARSAPAHTLSPSPSMAANLQGSRSLVKGIGRRIVTQRRMASEGTRRDVPATAYEKNPDEPLSGGAVPDDLLEPKSDKYWGPSPKTGVFGPAGRKEEQGSQPDSGSAVLNQAVWFRPLEDVEKPPSV